MRLLLTERRAVAILVAAVTGVLLHRAYPFPAAVPVLSLVRLQTPAIYAVVHLSYVGFLFTTPLIAASLLLSSSYVFLYKPEPGEVTPEFPPYPDFSDANEVALVIGELRAAYAGAGGAPQLADHPRARTPYRNRRLWGHRVRQDLSFIVEGISVFLSLFDDNPDVKRIFCPPKEVYTNGSTSGDPDGIPLPPFAALVEQGKVCALNFPMALNPGLAKAIGTMMKLDYQRAVLLRIPTMERERQRAHRDTFFVCDEYQNFATVGGNDPNGDEKFFSMSRQARCIPIIATQSISSLKEALAGEGWRTLLQTFRTKIFLAQSDEFSIQTAAALCGKEDRLKVSYGLSEASTDARVSLLTGKTVSNKGTISATKTYATQKDFIFDERSFTLLRNAECIVIPFDGVNQREATYCYLKPWYLDREKSYWAQLRAHEI